MKIILSKFSPKRLFSSVVGLATVAVLAGAAAPAKATVYAVTSSDAFGSLDVTTGAFTSIATLTTSGGPAGLAEYGGKFYTADYEGSRFYSIDVATGALTTVGSSGLDSNVYEAIGSTASGIYGVDGSGNLYSINPSTGVATGIGNTGQSINNNTNFGLSSGLPILYFGNGTEGYELNTSTAAATDLGSYVADDGFNAATEVGGVFYGAASYTTDTLDSDIYRINIGGPVSSVTYIAAVNPSSGTIYGLASSVPEPSAWAMMILGVGLLGARLRRGGAFFRLA